MARFQIFKDPKTNEIVLPLRMTTAEYQALQAGIENLDFLRVNGLVDGSFELTTQRPATQPNFGAYEWTWGSLRSGDLV